MLLNIAFKNPRQENPEQKNFKLKTHLSKNMNNLLYQEKNEKTETKNLFEKQKY